ncbi:hypothetical protein OF83DRAFT_1225874 [Amylostereum chailletii]|nr:hypothetical protein OF83DRAFT_1225874 [Amylostereum chailletii]
MRFTLVLAALVASASASALHRRQGGYPTCAQPCIASAQIGSCSVSDLDCLCHNADFISSTSQCFSTSCSGDDLADANNVARQSCLAVHVTLTSSATASPSSTSAASSPTATSPSASVSPTSTSSRFVPPFLFCCGRYLTILYCHSSSSSGQGNGALAHSVNFLVVGAAALGAFVAL